MGNDNCYGRECFNPNKIEADRESLMFCIKILETKLSQYEQGIEDIENCVGGWLSAAMGPGSGACEEFIKDAEKFFSIIEKLQNKEIRNGLQRTK